MNDVKFLRGTAAQYNALAVKDNKTFYYLTDVDKVYLGERLLSEQDLSAYLTAVEGKDSSINVTDNKKIKVNISSKAGNIIQLESGAGQEGLYATVPEATDYTVSIAESTPTGIAKRYTISQGPAGSQTTVGTIDIPKDMVVQSGQVVVNPTGQPAGTYIELTLANSSSSKIYINVADLVDAYTAEAGAAQVQLAIDANNEISATIVAGSIGTTELADGAVTNVKIANNTISKTKLVTELQNAIDNANSAVQSITTGTTNGTINVDGTDVAVYGLGTAAYTNSSAYDASGSAATAEANAKAYADGLLTWGTIGS